MASQIQISDAGIKFITRPGFDSFQPRPYRDSGGLWTIGCGNRISSADVARYANGITEAQAISMLKDYLDQLQVKLKQCPLAGLLQHQWDAIFSFCDNCGFDAFVKSSFYPKIITKQTDLNAWLLYTHDQRGHLDEGLVLRRQAELKLFIYGLYC